MELMTSERYRREVAGRLGAPCPHTNGSDDKGGNAVNIPEPVTRPDGRIYQPLKIAAYAMVDEDDLLSGVVVLGTHDMARAQHLADEYAAWQLDAGWVAVDPETGWFREGFSSGAKVWLRDPVRGRAGVMFHKVREAA